MTIRYARPIRSPEIVQGVFHCLVKAENSINYEVRTHDRVADVYKLFEACYATDESIDLHDLVGVNFATTEMWTVGPKFETLNGKSKREIADICEDDGIDLPDSKPFEVEHPKEIAWLKGYKGNFEFYLSLRSQYESRGTLSDKQLDAIRRAIARDEERAARVHVPAKSFSIEPGTILILAKWLSAKLAEEAGCTRPHFAFEVIECQGETDAAYKLKLKLTAQRTTHCCVCGIRLTNPASVQAGIGPICGGRWGIKMSEQALAELAEMLKTTKEIVTWMPKRSIKERFDVQKEGGAA